MFSIIIPVYNSALFLREAINSVLGQEYDRYEVILVDDDSADGSLDIELEYVREYANISLIRQSHSGAGAARNAGVAAATGDYVLFLDADDYWRDRNLLTKIDRQIGSMNAQIVMFQMIQVAENGTLFLGSRKPKFPTGECAFLLKEVYPVLVRDGQVLASACNKCVKISLLQKENISFLEGTTGEDIDWALQVFSRLKTISFLNEEAYAYRQHHSGRRASENRDGAANLAKIILYWAELLKTGEVPDAQAVAGMIAFEYGIYMGYSHQTSRELRRQMRGYQYLLDRGLDRKTQAIARCRRIIGYDLTCLAVRSYLFMRSKRR